MGSRGTKRRALAWFPGRAGCRLLDDEFWPDEVPPVGTPRVCRPGPGQLILDQTDGQFTINAGEFIWPIQVLPVWGEQDWHALRTDGTTFEVLGDEALVLQFRGTWIVNDGVAEWVPWQLLAVVVPERNHFPRSRADQVGLFAPGQDVLPISSP